ncbi:uncharacterized protein LOC107620335 [Arachis ipaensis]|uniref:uncharacterized protein LOC107620335 n=1 Tax=Arachis ipaensis TaxID=130454 RepID=UPI0007AF18C8|nr:uncharacterized protein LOC107620335 [Arachis ipaensis]
MQEIRASIPNLEVQVGQLSRRVPERPSNTLPSNTDVNPKEEYKALPMGKEAKHREMHAAEELKEEKAQGEAGKALLHAPLVAQEPEVQHSQKLQEETKDEQFTQFLEIFKKLHINIPFAKVLEKMPPYMAWTITFEKALCDLGSSINLMPLSMMKKLGIQEAQPERIALEMADKSQKQAYGLVENVLVKVDDLYLPTDFVILDMEEDTYNSIILGRLFLATGRALIDVERGELCLRMHEDYLLFKIFKPQPLSDKGASGAHIDGDTLIGVERLITKKGELTSSVDQLRIEHQDHAALLHQMMEKQRR